jgi:hypothetical protein
LRMTIIAGIALSRPTTGFTKLLNIMDGTVHKQSMHVTNCMRRASIAGAGSTDGGMKTSIAGTQSAIGTIMTTTVVGITITNPCS